MPGAAIDLLMVLWFLGVPAAIAIPAFFWSVAARRRRLLIPGPTMGGDVVRAGRAAHPTPRGAAFRCLMPSRHEQESATVTDSRITFPPASAGPRTSLNLGRRGSHQRRKPARRLGARRQSAVSDRRFALENIERPQLARGPNGTLLAVLRVAGGEIRARRPCLEIPL